MLFILSHNETENNIVSLYFSFFCHLLIYSSKQPFTTRGQTEKQTGVDIGRNNVEKVCTGSYHRCTGEERESKKDSNRISFRKKKKLKLFNF